MEAEDLAGAYEGFLESDHALTDVSGRLVDWLFEDAERIMTPEMDSDYPLLVHAWLTDRP